MVSVMLTLYWAVQVSALTSWVIVSFLAKTFNSCSTSLHQGVQMGTRDKMWGVTCRFPSDSLVFYPTQKPTLINSSLIWLESTGLRFVVKFTLVYLLFLSILQVYGCTNLIWVWENSQQFPPDWKLWIVDRKTGAEWVFIWTIIDICSCSNPLLHYTGTSLVRNSDEFLLCSVTCHVHCGSIDSIKRRCKDLTLNYKFNGAIRWY